MTNTDFIAANLDLIQEELESSLRYQRVQKDILIVVHNQLPYLEACIKSIYQNTRDFNLYIWDNGSDPEVATYLATLGVHVHREEQNVGFIQPNNRLAEVGSSPYLILLNSDTVVYPEWDKTLIGWLQTHPKVRVVGYAGGVLNEEMRGTQVDFGSTPDYICGWCMCFSRHTFQEYGLFDETHLERAYGEDADFSLRLLEAGHQIFALRSGLVYHAGNATVRQIIMQQGVTELSRTFEANHNYLQKRWGKFVNERHRQLHK